MYKLVIVDDEEIIREGLSSIVDWNSLGFEVVKSVESGEEAVEYIEKNDADVVLTDIKMTFMSGLELAKYIFDNKAQIKVVVISGYKEFELARQALAYNVKNYLLKPARLIDIENVFKALKKDIDLQRDELKSLKTQNKEYMKMKTILQEQFCSDIMRGRIGCRHEMDKRIKQLGFDADSSELNIYKINISFKAGGSSNEAAGIYPFFRSMLSSMDDGIHYFTSYSSLNYIQIVAIAPADLALSEFESSIRSRLEAAASKLESVIGASSDYELSRFSVNNNDGAAYSEAHQDAVGDMGRDAGIDGASEKFVISRAKDYIGNNYDKEIGLEEVAANVYLNPIYFSRLFKQETGRNFTEYLMQVRVNRATELLKNPTITVYEVGLKVGYRNTKYFYRIFKAITGYTPNEYREIVLRKGRTV